MSERGVLLLSLLLLVASVAVYVPSLGGDYVYDDRRFVEENAAVGQGAALHRYFLDPATQDPTSKDGWGGIYRPLRTLSFRATALIVDSAGGQRTVNLLVHIANVCLVFVLLRSVLGRERALPALVGALAFSLHPLASESVAWISSRGDLLAMTGILGCLLLHHRGRRIASVLVFLLALLAKESAVVAPILAIILDGFEGGRERIRSRWRDYAWLGAALAAYLGVRFAALSVGGQGVVRPENFVERAGTVLSATLYYVWTTVFPAGLTFEVRIARGTDARWIAMLGLLVIALLLAGASLLRDRTPRLSLAVFWFFAALLPVTLLQFAFPLKVAVANRFAYPALVAFGLGLAVLAGRGRAGLAFSVVVLLAFAPITLGRAEAFTSNERLFSDVARSQPDHAIANFELGRQALANDDPEKAREHLVASVKVDPRHPQVHALLGEAFEALVQKETEDAAKRRAYLAQAFNAYNAAVRMWQAGIEEDRQLYGMTLVNAAYLAGVVDQPGLVKEHAHNLVTNRPPVPGTGAMRKRLLHRMRRISQYLGLIGEGRLSGAVAEAVEKLAEEDR